MSPLRLRHAARLRVEPSTERRPLITLDQIESGTGRLSEDLLESEPDGQVRFEPGDVLFSKLRPYLAKSALVTKPSHGTGELLAMAPDPMLLDPRYLLYLTLSRPWLDLADLTSYGTKMPRTSWEAISDVDVQVEAVHEQRRIADFLDDQTTGIDQIIAARQQQTALLGEAGLELQRELTTVGRSSQPRSTGVPWMPEIAESWPLLRVSQLFSTGSGTTPSTANQAYFGGSVPWVNTGDLTDGPVVTVARSVTEQALRDYPTLRVYDPGCLVIAMYGQGATKGRIGILDVSACVNQACCVLSPTEAMHIDWAAAWFRAHKVQIVELAMGSGQPNLSQEIIRSLRIPAPPRPVQRKIVTVMSQELFDMQAVAKRLADSVNLLQEFKRSLISAAVSGEFDASVAGGRGVPA